MEDKAKICRMLKPVLQETRDFKDLIEEELKERSIEDEIEL